MSDSKRNGRTLPCLECDDVLHDSRFHRILNKPTPADENYKYTNKAFRNRLLGEQYARVKGLKPIIEDVCLFCLFFDGILVD